MKVRVQKSQVQGFFGFYGTERRYPGDEFTLANASHFSAKWMEKMEEEEPKRRRSTKEEKVVDAS